jgi:hypothetical protein
MHETKASMFKGKQEGRSGPESDALEATEETAQVSKVDGKQVKSLA